MLLSGATSISGANFSYFRLSDNDDLYHCSALSSSRPAEKKRCLLDYDLNTTSGAPRAFPQVGERHEEFQMLNTIDIEAE